MSFGCERSCSSSRRASKYLRGVATYIYNLIEIGCIFFRVRVFMSSGSMGARGGGDAKTVISPNKVNFLIQMQSADNKYYPVLNVYISTYQYQKE